MVDEYNNKKDKHYQDDHNKFDHKIDHDQDDHTKGMCYPAVCDKYNFRPEYKYKYIWIPFFRQIQIKYIRFHQKWVNMNTNMIIWSDIRKYEYKYKYYHTQNETN